MSSVARPARLGGHPRFSQGPPVWPLSNPDVLQALQRAWECGSWGRYHGPALEALVAWMRSCLGVEHVLPCASGTASVELALRGVRVGPGDEVILSAYDFQGNFRNILQVGARPVLVDQEPVTGTLQVADLESARSAQTRAVLVSHLHGGVADLPRIVEWAKASRIAVIEDACQMPGAMVAGRPAGTWGDVGTWSFGGSKLLTAGRGGALFTNDAGIAQRCRLHTQRGNDAYPLSELQATVLLPQLEQLREQSQIRAMAVETLRPVVSQIRGLRPFQTLLPESLSAYYKWGWWYDSSDFGGLTRSALISALQAEGIAIDAGFRALHACHAAARFRSSGALPVASRADAEILVLHHPLLLQVDETTGPRLAEVFESIREFADELQQMPECAG